MWLGGITKEISKLLNRILDEELEAIGSHLIISTGIDAVLRAFDKEFILCTNYTKGNGELFCDWIENNHPGSLLIYVE